MLYFTIALRSKTSSANWELVVNNFNNTLSSIFNQTNSEYMVYCACNEIPELKPNLMAYRQKIQFVQVNTPKPNGWLNGVRDRAWKQLACCHAIKQSESKKNIDNGIFIFPVDADDYINCNVAEYVANHPKSNGFKSRKAYKWNVGMRWMEVTPYFGGSMNIMRLFADEMPDEMPDISLCYDKETCKALNEKFPVRWNDIEVENKFSLMNRTMETLPFPSTIYVLETGENISSDDPLNKKPDKKIHFGVLLHRINPFNKKLLTKKIRKEFGM